MIFTSSSFNMAIIWESLFMLVACTSVVLAVDRTLEEGAVGADVVLATISKIESANIFPSDKRLLRRIAFVETADGEGESPCCPYGGIWNVSMENFQRTKEDECLVNVTAVINACFESDFSKLGLESWDSVDWEDLNTPLLSALAARLLIYIAEKDYDIPTSSDVEGQASFWKTHYNTDGDEDKFIQDVEQLDQDEGCTINSDIIFVLDSSGSIGSENYEQVVDFTLNFVSSLEIGPTENQVGVIVFGDYGQVVFNLKTYSNKTDLLNAISNNIPYLSEFTNTADGLRVLIEDGFTEESGARLSANNVYRLAIVLTDGHSDNFTMTIEAAETVHNFYPPILVFAIGVTDNINIEELEAIATRDEYITFLSDFDESQFLETRDEQTYEFCDKSTIPVSPGERNITLSEGENIRYEIKVSENGLYVRLCVQEGYVILYASYQVPNPNAAFHDYKLEVNSLPGSVVCDYILINPAKSDGDKTCGNDSGNVYVSIEGGEEENDFEINITEGEEEEVIFPHPLPPTIIPDREDCDPSYTMDVRNKINMIVRSILMEWPGEQND